MTSSKLPYRMIMSYRISLICSALLLLPSIALAGNWSHWRGPSGNGSSSDAKPPVEWSATKNVKWKVLIPGRGSGSPVIWEDKVFVVTAVAADGGAGFDGENLSKLAFKIFCFDRKTGRVLWEKTAAESTPHEGTHSTNGFGITLHRWHPCLCLLRISWSLLLHHGR